MAPHNIQKSSRVYVAGHRGLVGSAIQRTLATRGYTDIITRTRAELDLTDQESVARFFASEKPEYVFLAAARVGGILANDTYPGNFIYENLMIQTNILHQSYVHAVRKLLFLGSSCVYPKHSPQPIQEEALMTGPLESTNSAYAMAKLAGIEMCKAYNRQFGTRFITAMPTNLFGPNDNFDLESSHVLPALIRKFHLAKLASQGNWHAISEDEARFGAVPKELKSALGIPPLPSRSPRVILWGTGSPRREFLHVDDVADACLFLMECENDVEMVNVGSEQDLSITELAKTVQDVVGFSGGVEFDTTKPDGTPRKLLSTSRLRSMGWSPKYSLRQGIASTYQWYNEQ